MKQQNTQQTKQNNPVLKNSSGNATQILFKYITLSPEQVKNTVIHSPHNPREIGSLLESELNELATDIRGKGQLEAIWLYMRNGKYEILDGARRCRVLSTELQEDIKAKVLQGDFTNEQLNSIAFSLSSGVGLSLIEKGRVWQTEFETGKYKSLRHFCEVKKLSLSQASDAINAFKLPENLKAMFPKITTVGKPTLKKLSVIDKAIRAAKNESNYLAVTKFEESLIDDIDQDEIDYELYQEASIKADQKYLRKLNAAKKAGKKAGLTETEIEDITVEKPPVEVSNNRVNSAIIDAISIIFNNSDLVSKNEEDEDTSHLPKLTQVQTKTGVKIDLQNLNQPQQQFAIEINEAFIDTTKFKHEVEPLTLDDVNAGNFAQLDVDQQDQVILMFNTLVANTLQKKPKPESTSDRALTLAS